MTILNFISPVRQSAPVLALGLAAAMLVGSASGWSWSSRAATPGDGGLCRSYTGIPAGFPSQRAGMVSIAGGTLHMGSETFYPEEAPIRAVEVAPFWIDRHEVTNAEFAAFVAATGYRTTAEQGLSEKDYPDLDPDLRAPGSMVFVAPEASPDNMDPRQWFKYIHGADWRHPQGPDSSIAGHDSDPVTQVSWTDASAYARWLGRDLPTEAEWEWAARGGLDHHEYAWGDQPQPAPPPANVWQGVFPFFDAATDGYHGVAPAGCFPPNGYGLLDMIGNVWEWTTDAYRPTHAPAADGMTDSAGVRVIKGGSWLCATTFCGRFRPAARQPGEVDLGSSHIGFRTVLRAP